jgi:cytochrome b
MKAVTNVKVWDLPLRLFHWALVAAIALAFLSSEEGSPLNQWHIAAGWIAGILIVFRLAWGFVGGKHSRFSDFVRPSQFLEHLSGLLRGRTEPSLGHNPLGAVSVIILLALTAVTVWTGAFGGEASEDLHEVVAWALLAIVAIHVAAVLIMSVLQRENLVRSMISGTKPVGRHPGSRDAGSAGAAAYLIAAAVVAGTVYGVLRYDPQAFTLRSAESFEHRASPAEQPSGGEQDEVD